jgi:iron complex outermembrane receptor protein
LRLPFGVKGYSQARIEPYSLETIEVLKGPASVLYGQSAPGGLVNMVSKMPQPVTSREIQVQTGSFGRAQGAFDFTGPIDDAGKVLYRVVALARSSDTQIDNLNERRVFVAPSLTFRPTADTTLTVMAQYQRIQSDGGGAPQALPAVGTLLPNVNGAIPTNRYIGDPNYDNFSNEQVMVGYALSHRLNDTWQFRQNVRFTHVDTRTQRVQAIGLAANQSTLSRYAWSFPERSNVVTVDNQAEAKFDTGVLRHTALVGVDYQREEAQYDESALVLASSINIFNPNYGTAVITRPPLATSTHQLRQQVGGYMQDSIVFNRFTFLLGGRYDWAGSQTDTLTASTGKTATVNQSNTAFTGRAGLVYQFDNGIAPYASYSTSFQPQAGSSRVGTPFEPTRGRQTEFGVKYQPTGYDAFITASVFDTRQSNVLTPDPVNINYNVQSGAARVRGIELEGKATLARGFDLTASYAYSNSRVLEANANGSGVSTQGNQLPFVPQHQASLWANYVFSGGPQRGLGLGGGVRYIGPSYGDAANVYRAPGVVLFDAALSYDLGQTFARFRGIKLSVNASNLLDRRYVSTCIAATGCYFGNRRTVIGTVNYKF